MNFKAYVDHVTTALRRLDCGALERVVTILAGARAEGRTVFVAGNGGSAATANHFVNDLSWGARSQKHPDGLRAVSLSANMALFSALGNDMGFEHVFVEQIRSLFRAGDVFVGISASGNSENLLRTIQYVNAHDGMTIGFVGFDGGKMKTLCRECVHVMTAHGQYGPVEDIHLILCHLCSDYLKQQE